MHPNPPIPECLLLQIRISLSTRTTRSNRPPTNSAKSDVHIIYESKDGEVVLLKGNSQRIQLAPDSLSKYWKMRDPIIQVVRQLSPMLHKAVDAKIPEGFRKN
jgi:hypothetical protein